MNLRRANHFRENISFSGTNPWKTLAQSSAFRNPWLSLRKDDVLRPNGTKGEYSFLELNGYCGILPIDEAGAIYMVGQYRYPTNTYSWEIPIGGIEENEAPLTAAKRELQEELGITAGVWEPIFSGVQGAAGYSNERFYGFCARSLEFGDHRPDETEVLERARIPLSVAVDAVTTGEISELRTVALILAVAAKHSPNSLGSSAE